jgi:hypothetical protein
MIFIIGVLCLATPVRKKMKECWDKYISGGENELEPVTYTSKSP